MVNEWVMQHDIVDVASVEAGASPPKIAELSAILHSIVEQWFAATGSEVQHAIRGTQNRRDLCEKRDGAVYVAKACDIGLRIEPAHQAAMLHTASLRAPAASTRQAGQAVEREFS
jgi:hypothetical protein